MYRLFFLALILLSTFSCSELNNKNSILEIPSDFLLDTEQMQLTEVLKYCFVQIDSFENDTIFSFTEKNISELELNPSLCQMELILSVPSPSIILSYYYFTGEYGDLLVQYKNSGAKGESLFGKITSLGKYSRCDLYIYKRENFILLNLLPTYSRVDVRIGDNPAHDHLLSIRQKNIIKLMLKLIEIKGYSLQLS